MAQSVTDRGLGLFGRSDLIFRFLSPSFLTLSSLSDIALVGHASILNDDVLSVLLTLFFEGNPLLFFRFSPAENCIINRVQLNDAKLNFNNRCSNSKKCMQFFSHQLPTQNRHCLTSLEESLKMSAKASSFMLVPSFFACFKSFWKYFWAWVRTWTTVRVFISSAINFHCLLWASSPLTNISCSACVHLPAAWLNLIHYGSQETCHQLKNEMLHWFQHFWLFCEGSALFTCAFLSATWVSLNEIIVEEASFESLNDSGIIDDHFGHLMQSERNLWQLIASPLWRFSVWFDLHDFNRYEGYERWHNIQRISFTAVDRTINLHGKTFWAGRRKNRCFPENFSVTHRINQWNENLKK